MGLCIVIIFLFMVGYPNCSKNNEKMINTKAV